MLTLLALSWYLGGNVDFLDVRILVGLRLAATVEEPIGAGIRELMLSATALGAFATLAMVVLGVAGWLVCVDRRAAALRLVCETGAGTAAANALKHFVGRPRPTVVAHWAEVTSSSFPSGHSADSAVVYLVLATLVANHVGRQRSVSYVQGVAVALVVLVGISRLYLGVHFPTDVLGGWSFGAAWVWICRSGLRYGPAASIFRPRTFHDVVVHPTQRLLEPPFLLFRGGPDWPRFWLRRHPRHCRFATAIPLDLRPKRAGSPILLREAQGVWCGPLTQHFGHAVATFGSRIAASSLLPAYVPLVFSGRPGEEPPPFLWQILDHFDVPKERVLIISAPAFFDTLSVLPEAERTAGGPPSPAYLDLLDKLSGPAPRADGSRIYVSRAGMWKGKIAGEAYLEMVMERCGFQILRPELSSLNEQLTTYRRASHLVFAEGSAVHGLQLLGRVDAEVTIVVRRRGKRLAQSALSARASSLSYIDAVCGLLHGVGGNGRAQPSAGMTLIDTTILIAKLRESGVFVGTEWKDEEFQAYQARDLRIWLDARARHPTHPKDQECIKRSFLTIGAIDLMNV